MAVSTYNTTNIAWSSFDTWSNYYSSDSNISISTVLSNVTPADSAPYQASEIRSNAFLYGSVVAETGGTVQVTSGYTQTSAASFTLANVNFASITTITIQADASYPYTFHSFRDASGGGGSALSTTGTGTTTGTITLSATTHTGVSTFYAYFTTTHVDPSS